MKNYLILLFLIINLSCIAQSKSNFDYSNFENQLISYEPKQNPNTSEKEYNYGVMIIQETKTSIKNDPKNFNVADYFNILSAFLNLKESKENIKMAFQKFKNAEGSCEYILRYENSIEKNSKYDIIRADYNEQLVKCKSKTVSEKELDLSEYCKTYGLNLALVEIINKVNIDDQKYRTNPTSELLAKQQKLDKQNQITIDSIFNIYKSYTGRSLVGKKYESVMWAVIQHSNVEMMEKYLPIVQKAVFKKELDLAPFKMLIDRYYGFKYGYQVFGSQSGFGFKLADDKKRKEIELKYRID